MAKIVKVSAKEARKLIEACGSDVYIVFENDLEKDTGCKHKMSKEKVQMIIPESKSIIANIDKAEDSFSTLSLYSTFQHNPFNIIRKGTKKEILLIQGRG